MTRLEMVILANSYAVKFYSKKQLQHAMRVAQYAWQEACLNPDIDEADAYCIGVLHDILKSPKFDYDTFRDSDFEDYVINIVEELTHNEEFDTYEEYIKKIVSSDEPLVACVKRADIKDHFLEDENVEKYYPIVGLIL